MINTRVLRVHSFIFVFGCKTSPNSFLHRICIWTALCRGGATRTRLSAFTTHDSAKITPKWRNNLQIIRQNDVRQWSSAVIRTDARPVISAASISLLQIYCAAAAFGNDGMCGEHQIINEIYFAPTDRTDGREGERERALVPWQRPIPH